MVKEFTSPEILKQCFLNENVEFVFGIPGGQTLFINDVLLDSSIRFITARHEGAAGHMADAYGRITGKPGIALATTGPGAANLLVAVGGAHRDSSPSIFITCNNFSKDISWDDNQDAIHTEMFKQFVKHSRFVPSSDSVEKSIIEAFRISLSGNPGPVHLDFARDALERGNAALQNLQPNEYRTTSPPVPHMEDIHKAYELLLSCKKPLIWAGNGCRLSRASDLTVKFAEKLQIPVITTYNGLTSITSKSEVYFGPRSRFGTKVSNYLLENCDGLLLVGASLNAASTNRWTIDLPKKVAQIDIDPWIIGKHYSVATSVCGDAHFAMNVMYELALESEKKFSSWLEVAQKNKQEWVKEVFPANIKNDTPINPIYLMQVLDRFIDEKTIVISDAGNSGAWTHLLNIPTPGHYLKPVGYGNMGFGIPAAIACKLARPDHKIITVVGDGCIGMSLAEIETAVREQTPILVLVINDGAYGNIKQEQMHKFGPRYHGVEIGAVDYAKVARALGAEGEQVTNPDDIDNAISRGLQSDKVYILDMVINGDLSVWNGII